MRPWWLLSSCVLVAAAFNPANYHFNHTIEDFTTPYTLFWKTDATDIYLALSVQTTGWIGFGIGEQTVGSMPGADIVTGSVANGVGSIQDRYAVAKETPLLDPTQDWTLVASEETGGKTILELKRALDTQDINDRPIVTNKPMFIIVAYGPEETMAYHGANRKATAVHFGTGVIADPLAALRNNPNVFTVEIRQNYVINATATVYLESPLSGLGMCHNWADVTNGPGTCTSLVTGYTCAGSVPTARGNVPVSDACAVSCGCTPSPTNTLPIYVIAMEIITPAPTAAHVHHVVLKANDTSSGDTVDVWATAHGSSAFVVPDACAYKFNISNGLILPYLQTHYDNTAQTDIGATDTSGVRLFFTRTPRQYECGLISLGDPDVRLYGQKFNGLVQTKFRCDGTCTTSIPSPLTIFGSLLHMHGAGKRMYTNLYRGGNLVMQTNAVDFYDSGFQRTTSLNFTFNPGDELVTTCIHKTTGVMQWGTATADEMCMEFVYYYPKLGGGTSKCGYPQNGGFGRAAVCGTYMGIQNITNDTITSFGTGAVGNPTIPTRSSAHVLLPGLAGLTAIFMLSL